jgi:tetratricopeptide (TPR) repeat protein
LFSDLCKRSKEQGKPDLALFDYNQAININPRYADAYLNRGVLYAGQGKPDLALSDYNQALNINPRDAMAYNNRGNLYKEQGKPDLALSDYNQATLIPETPMLTTIAGLFTTNRGNPTSPCPISIRRSTLIPD